VLNEQATWFETITGFAEGEYATTKGRLSVEGSSIVRVPDGKVLGSTGRFETPSLSELRARAAAERGARSTVRCLVGDARSLHRQPEFADGLFQVASQFNCLEMVGPGVTPEQGVTRYIGDPTQGPACAIAAGLAPSTETISSRSAVRLVKRRTVRSTTSLTSAGVCQR
jgi:hypothetical protein